MRDLVDAGFVTDAAPGKVREGRKVEDCAPDSAKNGVVPCCVKLFCVLQVGEEQGKEEDNEGGDGGGMK